MKKIINLVSIALLSILVQACGTGRTMVMEPTTQPHHLESIRLVEGTTTVAADKKLKENFKEIIKTHLIKNGAFKEGNDLTIEYRFIQFDEGNRFARWFTGGIGNAGEGELSVEVIYKDSNGQVLSKIHVGGKIGSGFWGGSFDNAIEKAAFEVVQYTKNNFMKK